MITKEEIESLEMFDFSVSRDRDSWDLRGTYSQLTELNRLAIFGLEVEEIYRKAKEYQRMKDEEK